MNSQNSVSDTGASITSPTSTLEKVTQSVKKAVDQILSFRPKLGQAVTAASFVALGFFAGAGTSQVSPGLQKGTTDVLHAIGMTAPTQYDQKVNGEKKIESLTQDLTTSKATQVQQVSDIAGLVKQNADLAHARAHLQEENTKLKAQLESKNQKLKPSIEKKQQQAKVRAIKNQKKIDALLKQFLILQGKAGVLKHEGIPPNVKDFIVYAKKQEASLKNIPAKIQALKKSKISGTRSSGLPVLGYTSSPRASLNDIAPADLIISHKSTYGMEGASEISDPVLGYTSSSSSSGNITLAAVSQDTLANITGSSHAGSGRRTSVPLNTKVGPFEVPLEKNIGGSLVLGDRHIPGRSAPHVTYSFLSPKVSDVGDQVHVIGKTKNTQASSVISSEKTDLKSLKMSIDRMIEDLKVHGVPNASSRLTTKHITIKGKDALRVYLKDKSKTAYFTLPSSRNESLVQSSDHLVGWVDRKLTKWNPSK